MAAHAHNPALVSQDGCRCVETWLHSSSTSSSTCNETECSSSVEETSEDDEIARKRARYACTFRPESSVLLYDSMYRVCCVYINVVVVFSSDLGIFEYFNIRILGRYIRTNSRTMLAALSIECHECHPRAA